jgi:UDP-3-O-[3-hydroxymyristoyl] glucosamine N-acyltransferase
MTTLREIAVIAGGEVEGDSEIQIKSINSLENAQEGEITFLANPKYIKQAQSTRASAIICNRETRVEGMPMVVMKNPYLGFARLMQHFYPRKRPDVGIDPAAVVSDTARVGVDVNIFEGAYIGEHAVIGDRVDIFPGCHVGDNAVIGDDTVLNANVSVYHGCQIGKRVIIHSGTVVGSDGFGFATDEDGWHHKIPQVGNVIIADDVEIGANCSIDRAVLGSTRIGEGSKIDNLVQIAHNVEIGKRTFIVAQVGISGSSKVGDQAILAGQVGVVGHVEIGDRSIVAAQAGVSNNVPAGEVYLGSPARPMMEMKRIIAVQSKLPELRALLKDLQKRVEQLETKQGR